MTQNLDVSRDRADKLIAWLRDYGNKRVNSRLIDERRCIPPYIVLDFGNQGLLGMQIPATYGGLGLGYADTARVLQQLAAIDMTLATFVFLNNTNGIRPIQNFAALPLQEELLPILAQGRQLAAFALSEPGAGSNLAAIASVAESTADGHWRLRGRKRWNASAWAGIVSVFVRSVLPGDKLGPLTGFVVRQGMPGVRTGPEAMTMGVRGMVQNSLHLDDVNVPSDHLLGQPGQGMAVVEDALGIGRFYTAAVALGAMQRSGQLMARYARRRSIITGRLLDNPVTRAKLSEIGFATASVDALVAQLAHVLDWEHSVPPELLMAAKIAATEHLNCVLDQLMQMLGGRGYMEPNMAPQLLRDGRLLGVGEGPNETLLMHLGRSVMQTNTVCEYLSSQLHGGQLSDQVREAVEPIRSRCLEIKGAQDDRSSATSWAGFLIGRVAVAAVELAAVRRAHVVHPTFLSASAESWALARFQEILQKSTEGTPQERTWLSSDEIAATMSGYETAIGDLEQTAAGEDWSIDPLLRLREEDDGR